MTSLLKKALKLVAILGIGAFAIVIALYVYMYLRLPDVNTLKNIQLQVPLKIYSADNKLIAQYGEKRRSPVSVDEVPPLLINAILATEDKRYYEHPGVDWIGLSRATIAVITSGRKSQGASTITMQVARNFFLTRKKTYSRKINEILLAIKIDATFSKEKILELYLNKIYLGHRAYGVAAAAQVYYGKQLNQLTLAQLATIAGLPQAPSRDNPISNPEAAKERRNHVLFRLLTNGEIHQKMYQEAINAPITARYHEAKIEVSAPYIAEMVRSAMTDTYGKEAYTNGYQVYTTINSATQHAANESLQRGLENYDKRRGYRGPIDNWGNPTEASLSEWKSRLKDVKTMNELQAVVVLTVNDDAAVILTKDGEQKQASFSGMSWARKIINGKFLGPRPTGADQVVKPGDVIYTKADDKGDLLLTQAPEVEGALVSINPKNGAVKALVGGYSYSKSHYNRVTQAKRQSGSAFKPFVYSAALAKGYTLASVINDAPVVTQDNSEDNLWRPHNVNQKFYGPTRVRTALVHSRNIVSIRLLRAIGTQYTLNYLHRFGFNSQQLPTTLTLALGAGTLTPMQLTTAYAVFANGGFRVKPYFITKVIQSKDDIVYQEHPLTVCENCSLGDTLDENQKNSDTLPAPQVITPQNAYLITNTLQDVIEHGTGRRAKVLNRPDIAGKTGTTNQQVDAWFAGYNPNLVTTVWVGFDTPKSLHAYAAQTALPIWIDFMREALKNTEATMLEQPAEITNVRIDPATGLLAYPGQKNAIFEMFRQKYAPTDHAQSKEERLQNALDGNENNSVESQLY